LKPLGEQLNLILWAEVVDPFHQALAQITKALTLQPQIWDPIRLPCLELMPVGHSVGSNDLLVMAIPATQEHPVQAKHAIFHGILEIYEIPVSGVLRLEHENGISGMATPFP
jgi:hypothetical protein